MAEDPQVDRRRQRLLVQATIPPLDEDGIGAFAVGTVAFAVITALAWSNLDRLRADGHGWWLHTAIAGLVIGLLATAYCVWRRSRRP